MTNPSSEKSATPSAERIFRDAVSDFEMTVGAYMEDPAANEVLLDRARARVLHLYAKKEASR